MLYQLSYLTMLRAATRLAGRRAHVRPFTLGFDAGIVKALCGEPALAGGSAARDADRGLTAEIGAYAGLDVSAAGGVFRPATSRPISNRQIIGPDSMTWLSRSGGAIMPAMITMIR